MRNALSMRILFHFSSLVVFVIAHCTARQRVVYLRHAFQAVTDIFLVSFQGLVVLHAGVEIGRGVNTYLIALEWGGRGEKRAEILINRFPKLGMLQLQGGVQKAGPVKFPGI